MTHFLDFSESIDIQVNLEPRAIPAKLRQFVPLIFLNAWSGILYGYSIGIIYGYLLTNLYSYLSGILLGSLMLDLKQRGARFDPEQADNADRTVLAVNLCIVDEIKKLKPNIFVCQAQDQNMEQRSSPFSEILPPMWPGGIIPYVVHDAFREYELPYKMHKTVHFKLTQSITCIRLLL